MILNDESLRALGHLWVKPYKETSVQPSSYEVHLAGVIRREHDLDNEVKQRGDNLWRKPERADSFIIKPGEFILGVTRERINVPSDMAAEVWGKSSWGRMGIMIHVTAGFIDAGFRGQIVLEIKNLSSFPIELHAGEAIAQIVFHQMNGEAQYPYGHKELNSHYQNQVGVVAAKAE